jgi:hypothetical protein
MNPEHKKANAKKELRVIILKSKKNRSTCKLCTKKVKKILSSKKLFIDGRMRLLFYDKTCRLTLKKLGLF